MLAAVDRNISDLPNFTAVIAETVVVFYCMISFVDTSRFDAVLTVEPRPFVSLFFISVGAFS
jgi:hypothetical protein